MAYEPQFGLGLKLGSGLIQNICKVEEWLLFCAITLGGEYRPAAKYLISLNRPVTFIDLGANVGFASWCFADELIKAKQPFKALLVEPHPDTFNELSRRIKDQTSQFGSNILVPLNGLVGKRSGTSMLRVDGCHTIFRAFESEAPDGGVYLKNIPYIDLEDYLDDEPIDLIKCDIECSEWDFVENYPKLLKRTGCVVMELHNVYKDPKLIHSAMKKAGLTEQSILKVDGDVSTEMFIRPTLATYPSASPESVRRS